jgi:hypothetical protein
MMVRMETNARKVHPIKAGSEPEKLSPSFCPFEARFATNHLRKNQYRMSWAKLARLSSPLLLVAPATMPTQIASTIRPYHHHMTVSDRPVKVRFGCPGTWTFPTNHFVHQTIAQGAGMTTRSERNSTRVRHVKSQMPKSIDSELLP